MARGRLACEEAAGKMAASPTDKMSVLRLRELLKNCFVETNPALEIFERKIFVWGMSAAIGQGESHEQRFDPENFAELRDDRDAAALTDERDVAVERFAQRALRGFTE